ncbi:MAG TPA: class I adenylate-forming enzyme family protein [Alphaproteobacteria bacterium]|nr:class I adenylate-forming enzyme family protein [Alphaproteobacteria bacterium]
MGSLDHAPQHSAEDTKRFVDAGYWSDDTLITYLERWAREAPDRAAIIAGNRTLTYVELLAAARRFANALLGIGVEKGDVVGVQLPNVPEFIIAHMGLAMMGGIIGTLHMPYRAGELAPLMSHARMKALICGAPTERYDAPATAFALKAEVPTLEHVIVLGDPVPDGGHSLTAMIEGGADDPIDWTPGPDDPTVLCFTSGTAAAPKAVLSTYRRIISNALAFGPTIGLSPDDVVMLVPPFTHVFGLLVTDFAICAGATNLLIDLFTPDALVQRIQHGRPSVVFCAPAHLAATLKSGLLDSHDCSSIRDVITGGALCPPAIAAAFERYLPNGRTGQLFGMTEVLLITQTPPKSGPEVRHHSAGQALDGLELRITGEDGNPLPAGAEGGLEVRGYTVLAGYLDNDEADRAGFAGDGWFRTGDLATIDADGNVAITGRVKDVINRGGIKINPTDIENFITAHESVVQAAVVPEPDDVLGERCCLFVELVPGASLSLGDATAWLEAKGVAKMRWPERLVAVDEMPMTPTRKILKGELIKRLA